MRLVFEQLKQVFQVELNAGLTEDAPFPGGRAQALRSGERGRDAELAAPGHGWPIAATHGAMPERGQSERQRRPVWRGKTFWLLLGRLPKVTRCKSGTVIAAHVITDMYAESE